MPTTPDPATNGLSIPQFLVQAGTHVLGTVRQILRPAGTLAGLDAEEFFVGSRRTGEVFVLPNGERLLITDRARLPQPATIDGVLSRHVDGKLYWLSHHRFTELKRHVAEGKLAERRAGSRSAGRTPSATGQK
jgi:hypothetical protein